MKTFLLATAALLTIAGASHAADLPPVMAVKAPPVVGYDWNGLYVGGYFGDAIEQSKAYTDPSFVPGVNRFNNKGLTIGVNAGYNWQFAPRWLIGVEGDVGYLGLNRTDMEWNDGSTFVGIKTDWYATARARIGYVTGPSLLYVTGGAAFVDIRDTFGDTTLGAPATFSSVRTGWTAGGGIETKLSRGWTSKTEYLFVDAGSQSFGSPLGFTAGVPTTFEHSFHVIKTGLNYKIGEPLLEGLPLIGPATVLPSDHGWGGFYAGVNAGGGISNIHTIGGGGTFPVGTEQDVNGTGLAGGGQIGFNYMITARYFVGAEADIGYLGVRGSEIDWADFRSFSDKTDWYGTARARFGTSTGPALLYVTGGAAWVHLTDTLVDQLGGTTSQIARTAGGWTIGGGTEVALDARWSARLESFYIDAGNRNLSAGFAHSDFKDRFTVVRAGVDYRFGN